VEHPNIKKNEDVVAFLLLLTSSDQTEQILQKLREFPREILESHIIYGEWDLLLKVKVRSLPELTKLVMRIRKIEGINKTSTLITTAP